MSKNNSNNSSSTVVCTINPNSPVKPNEASGNMAACIGETITVTMGMFFDGTGNNRFNVDEKNPLYKDDSYTNDHSNVSRASNFYKGFLNDEETEGLNIYVDGIGTTAGERDSLFGFALGTGETGVERRVKLGVFEATKAIFNLVDKDKIETINITFDVFGFSRGAAAARYFIHINSEKKKYYDNRTYDSFLHFWFNIKNYGYNNPKKVNININWRFAGLYETVSSYGIDRSNDVNQLGLMNINHVKNIFHIVASDEYREKFSITPVHAPNIVNGKLTSLKSGAFGEDYLGNRIQTFKETLVIPGVHSDIGGGYANNLSEHEMILFISKDFFHIEGQTIPSPEYKQQEIIATKVKDKFVEDGWYKEEKTNDPENSIVVRLEPTKEKLNLNVPHTEYHFKVRGSRKKIKNEYSHIPLTIMTEKAIQNGVNFDLAKIKSKFPIRETEGSMIDFIPNGDFLNEVYKKIKNNIPINTDELKKLRYKYLHWSSRYELSLVEPHQPRFNKNDKTRYEREIIPIN
ncbi:DUF2235 domain-containing protein [uncultured Aquimarina sp.]|uniref:T6SS phospholipase effector Tle1-like catalytic domain-containing protein n=1 Tax=uncultured Aquimarina sp. TaxID=575652 RepID=UPI00262EB819|nr:DUF2235 domain-containing protein [uncultured Aquimarina sp.]